MLLKEVFSKNELLIIENDLFQQLKNTGWYNLADIRKTNYDLEQMSYGNIGSKSVSSEVKNILRKKLVQIDKNNYQYDFHAAYQIWDIGSGCCIHSDEDRPFVATFYLNKEWNVDYGGLYVYIEDDDYKVIIPTYNTGIYYNSENLHSVTQVTHLAKEKRYTIHLRGNHINC